MSEMTTTSNDKRRVVVTGMGCVTSLGIGVEQTWQSLLAGNSGVRHIQQFDSSEFPIRIGSEVTIEDVDIRLLPDELQPFVSRTVHFGLAAVEQAWVDAGLNGALSDPWRAGVCVGAYNFPMLITDQGLVEKPHILIDGDHYAPDGYLGLFRRTPSLLQQRDIGLVSTLLSALYPLHGPNMTVQTACASATQAIGESFQMIRHGEADIMVTGGTDSLLSVISVTGFTLLGVASAHPGDPAKACRPFDQARDGLVLGEGSGILILEELGHAQARGAPIYGEIIGYGSSCDGYRFTDSHPEAIGPMHAMRSAIEDAGISGTEIDYINAHGTGTRQNDVTETLGMKRVLGDYAYEVPISSTKSQLGHLICAAGGIEAILTTQALRHGLIPPTINLETPDPDCDLDYVPGEPRHADVRIALSNSFGFGGQNGTLLMQRWDN